ncbi:MAG: MarR family transcriptional regulator, partial [Nitrospirae bacterium]
MRKTGGQIGRPRGLFVGRQNALSRGAGPLAQRVATGLQKIGLAVKSRAWKQTGPTRLTPLQGQILALLRTRSEQAGTVSRLAQALAVTLSTVSESVGALERKGLLTKLSSQEDGRVTVLRLTQKGKCRAEEVVGWPEFLTAAAVQLPLKDQEVL